MASATSVIPLLFTEFVVFSSMFFSMSSECGRLIAPTVILASLVDFILFELFFLNSLCLFCKNACVSDWQINLLFISLNTSLYSPKAFVIYSLKINLHLFSSFHFQIFLLIFLFLYLLLILLLIWCCLQNRMKYQIYSFYYTNIIINYLQVIISK